MKQFSNRVIKDNKRELIDSVYLILLQGINKFLPLLILPYLMRVLTANGYGYWGFSLAVVQYAMLVIEFGFDLSATKHIAQCKDDKKSYSEIFWAVFFVKTIFLLISCLLLLSIVYTIPTFISYKNAILCTMPMAIGSAYTFMWLFQGLGKIKQIAIINTLSKIILLPLIFLLVKSPSDYLTACFLQSFVFVLTAFISGVWLWKSKWIGPISWNPSLMKNELRKSFPLFLSRASTSIYTQLFVIILGIFCTRSVVGKYASAEALVRGICFIFYIPLTQAFFPRISNLSKTNQPEAVKSFNVVKHLIFIAMFLISVAIFAGAPYVSIFMGKSYEGMSLLLQIMAIIPLFIGLGAVYGQMGLVALGNYTTMKQFRDVYFIVGIVSLVSVSILTKFWKEEGAAFALTLSEGMVFVLMFYYFQRFKNRRLCSSSHF